MAAKHSKPVFLDPTSVFKLPSRYSVLSKIEGCFPNIGELVTLEVLCSGRNVDFKTVSEAESQISTLPIGQMVQELRRICDSIYSSTVGGPKFFVVTAAEHGAFFSKFKVIESKNLYNFFSSNS